MVVRILISSVLHCIFVALWAEKFAAGQNNQTYINICILHYIFVSFIFIDLGCIYYIQKFKTLPVSM